MLACVPDPAQTSHSVDTASPSLTVAGVVMVLSLVDLVFVWRAHTMARLMVFVGTQSHQQLTLQLVSFLVRLFCFQ